MSGASDLPTLLAALAPVVSPHVYVFLSFPNATYGIGAELEPIASFAEKEGLTLIVPQSRADAANEEYEDKYALISLGVHSDLQAVGLTAAITYALSERGISANIVAAFYHDHIFVPLPRADEAVTALLQLAANHQR
tara:strand:+ start:88426 stop:88836 length:411 start_codon:yes stop_codon:yes gene_type:complete